MTFNSKKGDQIQNKYIIILDNIIIDSAIPIVLYRDKVSKLVKYGAVIINF